jgi:hypothetical protein
MVGASGEDTAALLAPRFLFLSDMAASKYLSVHLSAEEGRREGRRGRGKRKVEEAEDGSRGREDQSTQKT